MLEKITSLDATTLVNKFARVYLSPYAKELPEMDSARWIRLIMNTGLPYKEVGQLLVEFIALNPPRIKGDGTAAGTMPDIDDLDEFIKAKTRIILPPCPCCANTRRVYVVENDGSESVTKCRCTKGEMIQECKNYRHCGPYSLDIQSKLFNVPCPFGEEFWKESKKKWNEDIKNSAEYKKGASFLKGGKIGKMFADTERTEKMEKAVDLPGVGEDVPF